MIPLQRCSRTLLAGAIALAASSAAAATEPPREVWIELPECAQPPYDPAQLPSSLALELSSLGLRARLQPSAARVERLRLSLPRCDPGADLVILRRQAPGAAPHEQELSLRDVPWPARARTLALLISDALRRPSWQEEARARSAPSRAHRPSPVHGSEHALAPLPDIPLYDWGLPQRSDPYRPAFSLSWSGALRASWLPRAGALLYGAGMGLAGPLWGPLEWAVEASHVVGVGDVSDTQLVLGWLRGALGADYNLASSRQLQLGPRLALAHLDGRGPEGKDMAETTALAGARLRISPRLRSERVSMDLLFDLGHPVATLSTLDSDAPRLSSWVLSVAAGLSIEL